jgi:hypothetical protein
VESQPKSSEECVAELCVLRAGFFLGLFFDPEVGHMFLRNVSLTFNGLQDVTFQKLELFMTTAVRTSNPTFIYLYFHVEV